MSNRVWSNAFIYLGTAVVTAALGLVSALLMTHLLAPEQYGRLGVFLSVLYIAMPTISLAAEGLIAVNKSTLGDQAYIEFRRTAVGLALISFSILQLAFFAGWVIGLVPDKLLLLIPAYALLRFTSTMAMTEYVAEQQARAYCLATILSSIVSLSMTYLFIVSISANAGWRVVALILAESLLLCIRYHGHMRILAPKIHIEYKTQILKFGLPSMVALAGAWALNESDKAFVASSFGFTTAGIYTAAATLGSIMTSFNQSLTNAVYPTYFSKLNNPKHTPGRTIAKTISTYVLLNAAFGLLVCSIYWATKDNLLPPRYLDASKYFYAIIVAAIPAAIYRPLGLAADYYKLQTHRAISIVTGGVTTIMALHFGPNFFNSALIAPFAMGAGYITTCIILVFFLKLHIEKQDQTIFSNNHKK